MPPDRTKLLLIALAALFGLLAWSGAQPYDRLTWMMEVLPIFLVLPVLGATYRHMFFALIGAVTSLLLPWPRSGASCSHARLSSSAVLVLLPWPLAGRHCVCAALVRLTAMKACPS